MKQETKELIVWAKDQLETMKECEYSWKKPEDRERCKRMLEFLDHVSELEKTLADGGLVRDNKGNWLKSGDRVRYIRCGSDGEWHTGTVDFDVNNLCWYLDTDDDGNLHLAHYYFEVERFEKLEG